MEGSAIRNITMASDSKTFAGVDLSSGRKPVTFAALDQSLKILVLEKWSMAEAISCLKEYPGALLAINSPARKSTAPISIEFKNKLAHAGYKSIMKNDPHQWAETDSQKCFRQLCEKELFPGRTLEGRIQRALILYEEGLQINDPMDFFEEITRHKLMQGILPLENLYSAKQLDALMAAYVAWMVVQRTSFVDITDNFILPVRE
jgi:hypothetical protein